MLCGISSLVLRRFEWVYVQCGVGYIDRLPLFQVHFYSVAIETKAPAALRPAHGEYPNTQLLLRCECHSVFLYLVGYQSSKSSRVGVNDESLRNRDLAPQRSRGCQASLSSPRHYHAKLPTHSSNLPVRRCSARHTPIRTHAVMARPLLRAGKRLASCSVQHAACSVQALAQNPVQLAESHG